MLHRGWNPRKKTLGRLGKPTGPLQSRAPGKPISEEEIEKIRLLEEQNRKEELQNKTDKLKNMSQAELAQQFIKKLPGLKKLEAQIVRDTTISGIIKQQLLDRKNATEIYEFLFKNNVQFQGQGLRLETVKAVVKYIRREMKKEK
ncbi:MAG: hypothetical protein Q7K42_03235 [Candidatus Diapherotrites archaeon]|nr:hypothetical protein [Candidatus Diapherotrites archaeon]